MDLDFSQFEFMDEACQNAKAPTKPEDNKLCSHRNVIHEGSSTQCMDCGEEISQDISFDKEWRMYSNSGSASTSDPTRCQARKQDTKTIFKDVEHMKFSERVVSLANKFFMDSTQGKIFRGNSRKAIIFACIFKAYKEIDTPKSSDTLVEVFGITKKCGIRGYKFLNLNSSKTREPQTETKYITPINLIEEIMDKFDASIEQKKKVIDIYERIRNKSSTINRSRPQSVAAGLVYYYITMSGRNINIKEFVGYVNLSDLTVNKIAKEITRIISNEE